VICGRNAKRGERVADDIASAGCPTIFVKADLAKVADCRKVVKKADKQFGRVDALINAAALTDRGNIFDTTEERYNEIFDVNVRAPFFLIQEAVQIMRRETIAGSIVNIQSMSAHGGQPFITAYCASKGALATLTRNIAHSLLKFRIRVNGLNIGWMSTPGEDAIQKKYHNAEDGWLDAAVKSRPFGRLIDPKEVARACAYLCSDESGLMTGANIDFDQNVVGTGDPPLEP
jgi:NAD(P)-dependent dehydrogenase (short-subunit alcohol dehydrogenase family)